MYSPALLDHFQHPRNAGELPPPAVTVEVSNPACGDIMRLSVLIEDQQIRDVRFKTRGCTASIACGSALTELIKSRTVEEAAQLSVADIANSVGGLPPASGHASVLALDALKQALRSAGK